MSIASHVEELKRRHAAIEAQIEELLKRPGTDDLKITELKKKKLRIKEEIERLSAHA